MKIKTTRRTKTPSVLKIILFTLLADVLVLVAATVLFDPSAYYGNAGETLTYDELFYDFTDAPTWHYGYYAMEGDEDADGEADFAVVQTLLKETDFQTEPRLWGRFLALFQNRLTSRGEILLLQKEVGDDTPRIALWNDVDAAFSASKIYTARMFKTFGNYYLFYQPHTENTLRGFSVCKLQNRDAFESNALVNRKATQYTRPQFYPSYYLRLTVPLYRWLAVAVFVAEVAVIYGIAKKKRKTKTT